MAWLSTLEDGLQAVRACGAILPHLTCVVICFPPCAVAWVLSTLEDIRAQQAAAGNLNWKPPPVAVLPLGTGGGFYLLAGLSWSYLWSVFYPGEGTALFSFVAAAPALHPAASGSSKSLPTCNPTPGNDLARCLGWGSGHGVWRQEGVATMLSEVQHAAPLHIDR